MPTRRTSETRLSNEAVRAVELRLARPHGQGGTVVGRAAIVAGGGTGALLDAVLDRDPMPGAIA